MRTATRSAASSSEVGSKCAYTLSVIEGDECPSLAETTWTGMPLVSVVPIESFYGFWVDRFTREEIEAMARAIWG